MIVDSIKNSESYKGLGKVYEALEFIKKTDFSKMELGKYFLDDDNFYYMVQEYDSKTEGKAEAHEKYIDVQYLADGEEFIGYAPITCEKELIGEKKESDCFFYSCETTKIVLKKGDFMVLYPQDIHMPGMATQSPVKCRKVVFKIKL